MRRGLSLPTISTLEMSPDGRVQFEKKGARLRASKTTVLRQLLLVFPVLFCSRGSLAQELPLLRSEPMYEVTRESGVQVPTRDGTHLGAAIHRPNAPGPFPALMVLRYFRSQQQEQRADFFAARGYAVVLVDSRGRGDSQGEWVPYVNEPQDGFAWLSNRFSVISSRREELLHLFFPPARFRYCRSVNHSSWKHSRDEPQRRCFVGKDPPPGSPGASPLKGSDPSPPAPRKIKHCQPFIQVVFQPAHELRCNLFELLDDFTLELLGILSRRGIENVPHGLGDAGLVLFAASILLGVFTQVKLTTVPGHRRINCPPGRLQSFVIVTDKQLGPLSVHACADLPKTLANAPPLH